MGVLISAVVLLGGVMVFNLLVTLGLVRRIRTFEERGLAAGSSLPTAGTPIPKFEVPIVGGGLMTDGHLRTSEMILAMFFAPGCVACDRVKAEISDSPPTEPIYAFVTPVPHSDDLQVQQLAESIQEWAEQVGIAESESDLVLRLPIQAFPTILAVQEGVVLAAGYDMEHLRSTLAAVSVPA